MQRSTKNAKFIPKKLNYQKEIYEQPGFTIQEMSLNLLNEIDRKYESISCDNFKDRANLTHKAPASKSFSQDKNQTQPLTQAYTSSHQQLQNYQTPVQGMVIHTQPSDRKYSHQKSRQNDKIQEIQQSYLKFRESHSTKKSSIDKENIQLNTEKGQEEINHIITCLEQRFIHDGRSNKSQSQHSYISKYQTKPTNNLEQELKQHVQSLNNRDASQRLDIAKIKKQHSELNQKYLEAVKKIQDLEKLSKRDDEYIIRMDNNMMQMKQKLTQVLVQKNTEKDKIIQQQLQIKELLEENIYIKSLLDQHNVFQQQRDIKQNNQNDIREKLNQRQSLQNIEKRSEMPIFLSTSSMSNFSFVQNSDRKNSSLSLCKEQNQQNSGVDGYMISQILNLNEQLSKQISLSKLSKDQANEFINYLQDQITSTSTHSEHVESLYRNQQSIEIGTDDLNG